MLTDILRIDRISLFDLDFKGGGIPSKFLERLNSIDQLKAKPSRLYAESFNWVFYGPSLPGCERFTFAPESSIQNIKGGSVLINRDYGVGVYSVWQTFNADVSPQYVKHYERPPDFRKIFSSSGVEEIERNYPFIGILLKTFDFGKYCTEHAVELGQVFTGNLENEDNAQLEAYIRENLSRREYERFFLRWTEGLGVYGNIEEEKYEKTLFRAVQIFETCILVRRLLRNITKSANDLSGRLSVVTPRPWAVNRLLEAFLQIQRVLVTGPPVQSVEGERLLRSAYHSFGIDALVDSTRQSCDFLERRFQWVKTQLLVAIGIVTYFLDKLLKIFIKAP